MREREQTTDTEATQRYAVRMQELLRSRGWSGRALADAADVSPGTAAAVVRGEVGPVTSRLRLQIAQAFDWNSFEAMLDGSTIEPPPQYRYQRHDASFYVSVLKTLLAIVDTHPDAAKRVIRMAINDESADDGTDGRDDQKGAAEVTKASVNGYGWAAVTAERQLALA